MHDWTHHMITDAGVSVFGQHHHHHTQQKCFDRRQRGVNHIISDSSGSIRLRVSLPLRLYKPDPVWPLNLKLPDRIFLTVFLGFQMDTLHPKCFWFIYLSLLLIYLYDFWDACQRGALIRAFSSISSLFTHCKSILKWIPLSFSTFQVYKSIGSTCFD